MLALCGASFHYHLIGLSVSLNRWYCASRAGGSERYAAGTTVPATSTWVHVAGVFTSSTARAVFVNGTSEGSDSNSVSPTLSKLTVAVRGDGAIPGATPGYFTGSLAHVAVWNAALAAAQIAELARGASPLVVAPSSLVWHAPLWGEASPEVATAGSALSLTGSPSAGTVHPPVFLQGAA